MNDRVKKIWGEAEALWQLSRRIRWIDLLLLAGLAGIVAGVVSMTQQMSKHHFITVQEIDLSPWALPRYTFYSFSRGAIAYVLSLIFTLLYGYWAAKDRVAEKVLVPLLDILQSIPLLSFMPGAVLAMIALFPSSRVGLEIAAIFMIFTSQVWNMTFSFYHSVRSVPLNMREVATVYRFNWWQRLKWVELPYATVGLAWNSMMSVAGGWFFLMISETFTLGKQEYWLPGLGSYMSKAVQKGDYSAEVYAVLAMVLMIVVLDQLLWRPLVVWAQKFRMEETASQEGMSSWFLEWLKRIQVIGWLRDMLDRQWKRGQARLRKPAGPSELGGTTATGRQTAAGGSKVGAVRLVSLLVFAVFLGALGVGALKLYFLLKGISLGNWAVIGLNGGLTLARVLTAVALGTLWTLPVGLAIGLNPKLSRLLQPVMQVLASFPVPMLYPLFVVLMLAAHVSLDFGSIGLMLLGTQWYILFNIIAGASAIPGDLREMSRSYRLTAWQRFKNLYLPAIFPYLVTAWVTAAGGAWNASIVAELVTISKGNSTTTLEVGHGLGAQISRAASTDQFALLAAATLMMSLIVVVFNRLVWRRLYRLAEERYSVG
ncbi:MAG: ABC transporter permease [Planctomycetota bacterium]